MVGESAFNEGGGSIDNHSYVNHREIFHFTSMHVAYITKSSFYLDAYSDRDKFCTGKFGVHSIIIG